MEKERIILEESSYPEIETIQTGGDEPNYCFMQPERHTLTNGEGYTYMPLEYNLFTLTDENSTEVGEMKFLNVDNKEEITVTLYISDFHDATLYVCLDWCECKEEVCDCDCVTFLIEFNNLRIPFHKQLQEQQLGNIA